MHNSLSSEESSWESMLDQEIINVYEDYPKEHMSALLRALTTKQNPNLRGLSLSCNRLTPKDLDLVATIVEHTDSLIYLELSDCEIGAEHIQATHHLGLAITRHRKLRGLSLSSNDLSHETLPCLKAIMLNETLLELDLSCISSIDEHLGPLLLDHLKNIRCRIVSLNLIGTPLSRNNTLDQVISTQLNKNIARLLQKPENWLQIDIPESIETFLSQRQNNLFDDHTENQKMRYQPLICLRKRQLTWKATHPTSEILPLYTLAQETKKHQDQTTYEKKPESIPVPRNFKKL